jgi:biotin carboxyl carrier protein
MVKVYKINGNEYQVSVNSLVGNHAEVQVNGVTYQVEISDKSTSADLAPKTITSAVAAEKTAVINTKGDKKSVTAPLPGVIVALKVQVGEQVKAGQTIAVLEAMKMENDIQSEYDGVILSVDVNTGDSVLEGATIVTVG